jgi:ribosomal protein S15P/S13E
VAKLDSSKINALTKKTKFKSIKTGDMPQKIAALATFHSGLINHLSDQEKSRIQQQGLKHIAKYFESYIDHLARVSPERYHHVYEPGMTGMEGGRLFSSNVSSNNTSAVLSYSFKPSRVPVDSGHVFKLKAQIMESGTPVTIRAKRSKKLAFEVDGEMVFATETFVSNPGGVAVQNSFTKTFNEFMTAKANQVLIDLGFYERIEKSILEETKLVLRKISNGTITGMAAQSAGSARKISRRA